MYIGTLLIMAIESIVPKSRQKSIHLFPDIRRSTRVSIGGNLPKDHRLSLVQTLDYLYQCGSLYAGFHGSFLF